MDKCKQCGKPDVEGHCHDSKCTCGKDIPCNQMYCHGRAGHDAICSECLAYERSQLNRDYLSIYLDNDWRYIGGD